ncbi:DMT family transporter [Micromonospora sp. WMMD710]|uniref:DMT family transporter n=1 Tax=Micromonospora sp. WMMD710 TaxID=3016085 RepID=UPI0024161077|nr:DMT family transporter [Micromonospora sp. WMMD710]MDG4760235.1 DMT family transporter [Micromonospora sp. WMMD710]
MAPPDSRPSLDPLTTGAVGLAVVAVSSSAPLIAYAAAPALAIAFWRNMLAVAVLSPFSLARRRAEFRRLAVGAGRREGLFCVLSGVALAAHFATWVPSAQLTSVAAATALGATQPVWQGLIARGQGRRLPPMVWIGIAVAVSGAVVATGADVGVSGKAVLGDLLAMTGGMFAAVYVAFGERARASISTTTYTTICYGICALVLLLICLVGGVRLTGFDGRTWLAILALVAGAQLLGHSMFSYALQKIRATTVSVLILLEVPGAALLGWAWLGQLPRPYALLGMALLLVGVAVVVLGGARAGRRATPPTPLPADAAALRD